MIQHGSRVEALVYVNKQSRDAVMDTCGCWLAVYYGFGVCLMFAISFLNVQAYNRKSRKFIDSANVALCVCGHVRSEGKTKI